MFKLWKRLFLEERPSISLSFFRMVVALTTGLHLIPTFFHLDDNYFATTALKTVNLSFFPSWFITWVQKSPDGLVVFFVILFCASCFFMLIGLFSQLSCIVMTLCCYYFYALNDFAIGHILTWDILMVTLFLMCISPYPGDYFSVDALRRNDPQSYKKRRPYFHQRLLQFQIAFTYFYTALYKITASGNWLTDNPFYYLMNYPSPGVTKHFLLKEFLAVHPGICYVSGIFIVGTELLLPFLLFYPRTRLSAIYLGFIFHVSLLLTLDVPSIFFFLFPPQFLLFIHPDKVIRWIEQKRLYNRQPLQSKFIFDGLCQFCVSSVKKLEVMDLFGTLRMIDYQKCDNISELHPELTKQKAHSQIHLIEPDGALFGGFSVLRRLCFMLPMLYPLIPFLYFPGMGMMGSWGYRWVAQNRYFFHFHKACQDNHCYR